MEELFRDFTVCKNCGKSCYLNNDYCEDCANAKTTELEEQVKKFEKKIDKIADWLWEAEGEEVWVDDQHQYMIDSQYITIMMKEINK